MASTYSVSSLDQDKFLKNYLGGLIKWRDEKAIHEVTQKYIDELMIKCTSSLQKAKELSGGNQQKVCLAKAFALEPYFSTFQVFVPVLLPENRKI